MALVVICGQPCSGKSTAAHCLAGSLNALESKPTVKIIDESLFHLDRNQCYANMTAEKNLRRFEKPERRNRWDSPLFVLWPSKDRIEQSSAAVVDTVSYLTKKVDSKSRDVKILQPTIATQNARLSEANTLYEMDRATQEVINAIVEAQSQALGGPISGISLGQNLPTISIQRAVGLPELRSLRRTFIKLTGQSSLSGPPPPSDTDSAKRMFVDYLNRELGTV
uniref:Protein KTI12 homolog n=1 Tax=Nelumbo nucifera TaxID=4432 RepID=A0A822YW96_NELNU|nr:TPA_asm: hypothetical protein HUJ06_005666 [Nelumbo nucifera]